MSAIEGRWAPRWPKQRVVALGIDALETRRKRIVDSHVGSGKRRQQRLGRLVRHTHRKREKVRAARQLHTRPTTTATAATANACTGVLQVQLAGERLGERKQLLLRSSGGGAGGGVLGGGAPEQHCAKQYRESAHRHRLGRMHAHLAAKCGACRARFRIGQFGKERAEGGRAGKSGMSGVVML